MKGFMIVAAAMAVAVGLAVERIPAWAQAPQPDPAECAAELHSFERMVEIRQAELDVGKLYVMRVAAMDATHLGAEHDALISDRRATVQFSRDNRMPLADELAE